MAYFNHAFSKVFLGTQVTGPLPLNPNTNLSDGFISVTGLHTSVLANTDLVTTTNNYGPGSYGLFNAKTNLSVSVPSDVTDCCPLILASASLLANDKIGPFHGGYKESNKSKLINPKFVRSFYRVDQCTPQQAVVSVGNTPASVCAFDFLCGETYYLRVDIKGSPALRSLNHNAYITLEGYTGCCPTGAPLTIVDSTLVMIAWATQLVNAITFNSLVMPVVFDETGVAWYAPGTTVTLDGTNTAVTPAQWWTAYVSPGHIVGATAGLRLFGAYVETKFGNCSFSITDFYEKEPLKIIASLVDLTGDVCVFEGLCVVTECFGVQGMGFGETVLRDLILSESYLQNFVHTDVRIREITQGDNILGSVNRNALYTRYYILHSVPRYNNPTGVFDNDQYLLEIISSGVNLFFQTLVSDWLGACTNCVELEVHGCTACVILPD